MRPSLAETRESLNTIEGGARAVQQLLAETHEAPTAILCGNDLAAIGAMRALAELGYKVPDDVSVIGADDIPFARYAHPSLTTIRAPRDKLGALAHEALARLVRSKRRIGVEYSVKTLLVVRESTGKAKKTSRSRARSG